MNSYINTFRYTLFGVAFGFTFPLFSWLIDLIAFHDLSFNVQNLLRIHKINPLHYIIDTAPFFLGISFGIAGRKQDDISKINRNLEKLVLQRTTDLEEAIHNLESLSRDLEDRVLQRTNDLTEANRIKDKMLSIISHDLRSPLSSLAGTLNLLNQGVLSEEEQKSILGRVTDGMHYTSELLENLLSWANSQGTEKYKAERCKVFSLVETTFSLFNESARNKKINLINSTNSIHEIYADVNLINLVLRNLVSNALKFTESGGEVVVHSEIIGVKIRVSVIDNGVGMNSERIEVLFKNEQNKISTPGTLQERGSGIGLLLCKEFIEKHQGSLHVTSAPGKGSVFSFELPSLQD